MPEPVAAFDLDNTLTTTDTFRRFLVYVQGRTRVAALALARMPRLVGGLFDPGLRDAAKAAMVKGVFRGMPASEYAKAAASFSEVVIERHLRQDTVARLRWHQAAGHRVAVVSASLDAYVAPIGAYLNVDHVIATALEVGRDGTLTGRLDGPNVRTHEKARRLKAWLGDASLDYAYGDSEGDREMLALAEHGMWVRGEALEPEFSQREGPR